MHTRPSRQTAIEPYHAKPDFTDNRHQVIPSMPRPYSCTRFFRPTCRILLDSGDCLYYCGTVNQRSDFMLAALASAVMPDISVAGVRASNQGNATDEARGIDHAVVRQPRRCSGRRSLLRSVSPSTVYSPAPTGTMSMVQPARPRSWFRRISMACHGHLIC